MAERHRQLAELTYGALGRRDIDTFLAHVAEDIEFRSLVAEAEGQDYRGHEGVRKWWNDVAEMLGGLDFDMLEYSEEGDGIVTKIRVAGRHGTTVIEQIMWQAVQIVDSTIVWWQTFRSEREAWSVLRERLAAA